MPIRVLHVDGIEEILPGNRELPLAQMQSIVEGYIEIVPCDYEGRRCMMVVNEHGALSWGGRGPLPVNVIASRLRGEYIHGTAIVYDGIALE